MTIVEKFIRNWVERHQTRCNIVLHAIGIPLTIIAFVFLFWGKWILAIGIFVAGYTLQFVGHAHEKSPVGEFLWIKNLFKK